jgi:hypothetical protein
MTAGLGPPAIRPLRNQLKRQARAEQGIQAGQALCSARKSELAGLVMLTPRPQQQWRSPRWRPCPG